MSNIGHVPEEINVGRGDPVYMAHAYLTKVPVPAIVPFIEAYCPPGGVVADPFAGSGMTGVAAAVSGRRARLSDISVLGRHIGSNYVNLVDGTALQEAAKRVIAEAKASVGSVYMVPGPDGALELVKTVWSVLVECLACGSHVNYYRSMEAAGWSKQQMVCPVCGASVSSRNPRVGEEPVLDYVRQPGSKTQEEREAQNVSSKGDFEVPGFPVVEITPDREMYKSSALGKNGLTTVASFYSPRNLRVLAALRQAIQAEPQSDLRSKLLFAFTATLTRASKRYQWSRQRPLNAANANYYIAPVFYEWNVFDLFERKVVAARRSDEWIEQERSRGLLRDEAPLDVTYQIASADCLPYEDASVDYVFTDPPFGSNLFYADMALFQEGWLGGFTDVSREAVIDRSRGTQRSSTRYEDLLSNALSECRRILKPGGRISMIFGNSSGSVWALVQRAVAKAGLGIEPEDIAILNKGQRSVKGLASGFEHVATLDLILTMQAADVPVSRTLHRPTRDEVTTVTAQLAEDGHPTPSHLYLELLRHAIRHGWSVADLDLKNVTRTLVAGGWGIDTKSGRIARVS